MMVEKKQTFLSQRGPTVIQALIWLVIVGMPLVLMLMQMRPATVECELFVTGDRTNLYVGLVGVDTTEHGTGTAAASRLDARGEWSKLLRIGGRATQFVAWQEDLVALFEDGGLYFEGPSGLGYQPPPGKEGGQWQPLAAAAEEGRLLTLGLDENDQAVFCEWRGASWGEVKAADVRFDWTADAARTARAAMRQGEFHVVWLSAPVSETPVGGEAVRWLRFAWRDAKGRWKGPYDAKEIRTASPVWPAPYGKKLALVYREGEGEGANRGKLAYAEFTSGDRKWHRVCELDIPAKEEGGGVPAWEEYGFASYGDEHVVAGRSADGQVGTWRLDPETGAVVALGQPPPRLPESLVAPAVREGQWNEWFWTAVLVSAALFILLQMVQRKAIRDRLKASAHPDEEAAKILAAQYERLMYLPVLVRRLAAAVIDIAVVAALFLAMLRLLSWYWPAKRELLLPSFEEWLVAWRGTAEDSLIPLIWGGLGTGLLVIYYLVTELAMRRSPGKLLLGLVVVDLRGHRPAWWRIVVRNLVRPIDTSLGGMIGVMAILWTQRNQRLGDLLAGTRVVRSPRVSGSPQDGGSRTA